VSALAIDRLGCYGAGRRTLQSHEAATKQCTGRQRGGIMGTAGATHQGLRIRTRKVAYSEVGFNPPMLEKFSEVSWMTTLPSPGVVTEFAQGVHDNGLKIGMNFHRGHTPIVGWAADEADHAAPETLTYTGLIEDHRITTKLNDVFSTDGKWRGYEIPAGAVIPAASGKTSLYFNTRLYGFGHHHPMDIQFVPVVVALGSFPDFTQHYAIGVGIYGPGKSAQGFEFDTHVLDV
jgi:hypothetical protein